MASSTLSKAFILSAARPLPPQQQQQQQQPLLFNGQCRKFSRTSLTLRRAANDKTEPEEGGLLGSALKNATDTYAEVKDAVVEKSQEAAEKFKQDQDSAGKKLEEAADAASAKAKETKDFVAGKADEATANAEEFKDSTVAQAKENKGYVEEKTQEGKGSADGKIGEFTESVEDAAKQASDALFGKKD